MNGKGERVAEGGAEDRGNDVATDQKRDRDAEDDVETDEGREGGEDAEGEAERDGMRRAAQAKHPLPEIDRARAASPSSARTWSESGRCG